MRTVYIYNMYLYVICFFAGNKMDVHKLKGTVTKYGVVLTEYGNKTKTSQLEGFHNYQADMVPLNGAGEQLFECLLKLGSIQWNRKRTLEYVVRKLQGSGNDDDARRAKGEYG
jgi:hypothetical protein